MTIEGSVSFYKLQSMKSRSLKLEENTTRQLSSSFYCYIPTLIMVSVYKAIYSLEYDVMCICMWMRRLEPTVEILRANDMQRS